MHHDHPWPMTLAIADHPLDLHVLAFSGREALNEAWYFDIDLVSRDPHLDIGLLLQRPACLHLGAGHPGIGGEIAGVRQLHAGTCLSHYRISLRPRLQRLAQPLRQRLFQNLNVPQIIERLLREHGLDNDDYRFDPLSGVYPPRPLCVQHQESDLHLLQRLCEEEGLHLRFEGRQLVVADDSARFPERVAALRFAAGGPDSLAPGHISHLGECLALRPVRSPVPHRHGWGHDADCDQGPPPVHGPGQQADNQPFAPAALATQPAQAWQRQRSVRQLERLRCEARDIQGDSAEPTLSSGQVMQVTGHPEGALNDYWLLVFVMHFGKQPEVLEGHDPHDIAMIVQALVAAQSCDPAFAHGYRNRFGVIPWTQAFRPTLRHPKPVVHDLQPATLMGTEPDAQGTLPVRLQWQPASPPSPHWPRALLPADATLDRQALRIGCQVLLGHLDNDPDRPIIRAISPARTQHAPTCLQLDGQALAPVPANLVLHARQRLHIQAAATLRLQGTKGAVTLASRSIEVHGLHEVRIDRHARGAPHARRDLHDLRLVRQGIALRRCVWYIVRMAEPGLEHLSRLDPEHFLFEGCSDAQGYLGLSPAQRSQLAVEYARTPHQLCLIHPGQCIVLHQYLRQSGNDAQHQALLDSALHQSAMTP